MRVSKISWIALFAGLLVFGGCKKPKTTGALNVKFITTFNGRQVNFDTTTFTSNGKLYQFSALKFYISRINLIGPGGTLNAVKDAALIDFSNPNSLTLNFQNLKGDYTGLQFICGLDSVLDNSDPVALDKSDPTNPLAAANAGEMYWQMQKYRFESFDGKWDDTSNTYSFLTHAFTYHVGGPGLSRTCLGAPFTVSIVPGNTVSATVYLHIENIFTGGSETINIATEGATQTLPGDNPAIATKFADNFAKAFSNTP